MCPTLNRYCKGVHTHKELSLRPDLLHVQCVFKYIYSICLQCFFPLMAIFDIMSNFVLVQGVYVYIRTPLTSAPVSCV